MMHKAGYTASELLAILDKARAVCEAMAFGGAITVNSLQDLHKLPRA